MSENTNPTSEEHSVVTEESAWPYEPDERMKARIANDFTFHPVKSGQAERYEVIRANARWYAEFLVKVTPPSREQSMALSALDDVVFFSNASIARNE